MPSTQLKIYTLSVSHIIAASWRGCADLLHPASPEVLLPCILSFTHQAQSSSAQQLLALEAALSTEKARAADAEAEAKKLKERLEKANKVINAFHIGPLIFGSCKHALTCCFAVEPSAIGSLWYES